MLKKHYIKRFLIIIKDSNVFNLIRTEFIGLWVVCYVMYFVCVIVIYVTDLSGAPRTQQSNSHCPDILNRVLLYYSCTYIGRKLYFLQQTQVNSNGQYIYAEICREISFQSMKIGTPQVVSLSQSSLVTL